MRTIKTLLFSGGGIRCISYYGALNALLHSDDFELDINNIYGVSAGSIIGLCLLLDYSFDEFMNEIIEKDFNELKDIRFVNFLYNWGMDSGNKIVSWLEILLIKKGYSPKITFIELYKKNGIKFTVLGGNLNKYKFEIFNYINSPNICVLDAIRMSISIPFIFTIKKYKNDTIVDGGIISNYPLEKFICKDPRFPEELDTLLGFKIINWGEKKSHVVDEKILSMESYIYHVISCYIIQKDKKVNNFYENVENDCDLLNKYTILIEPEGYTTAVNFNLTKEQKKELIEMGRKSFLN